MYEDLFKQKMQEASDNKDKELETVQKTIRRNLFIMLAIVVSIALVMPVLVIFSLNSLFNLGIVLSLKTYFSAALLTVILGSGRLVK